MCRPKPKDMAEFRDTLRDILVRFHDQDISLIEETILNIAAVASETFVDKANQPKRNGTAQAMFDGLNKIETLKAKCHSRFMVNFPWDRKEGQNLLEFLTIQPEDQTIDKFADWWYSNDWRGKNHQPPSIDQIFMYWPQAFGCAEFQSDAVKPKVFRATENV